MCAEMLPPIRGCPCMSSVECSFRVFADVLPAVSGGEYDRCHAFHMFAKLLLMEMNISMVSGTNRLTPNFQQQQKSTK